MPVPHKLLKNTETCHVDENGNKVIGPKEINGAWNYFDKHGELITNNFCSWWPLLDKDGKQVDSNKPLFRIQREWYYAGNDGAILKDHKPLMALRFTSYQNGIR